MTILKCLLIVLTLVYSVSIGLTSDDINAGYAILCSDHPTNPMCYCESSDNNLPPGLAC